MLISQCQHKCMRPRDRRTARCHNIIIARFARETGSGRSKPANQTNSEDIFKGLVLKRTPTTLDSSNRAASPGIGKAGRPTKVLTNLFKLSMPTSVVAYKYSVDIAPVSSVQSSSGTTSTSPVSKRPARKVSKEDCAAIMKQLSSTHGWENEMVFDNASLLHSIRATLEGTYEVSVKMDAQIEKTFQVKIAKVDSLDVKQAISSYVTGTGSPITTTNLIPSISLMDMVSKATAAEDVDSVRTPSGYLSYKTASQAQSFGQQLLKILSGFRSSVRVVKSGVVMSLDHQVGAVLEDGPLMEVLIKAARFKGPADLIKLKQKSEAARVDITDFQVKLSHTGQKIRLQGFSPQSARELKFKLKEENNRETTVEKYYKERYNVILKHPELPCVLAKNGSAFPVELCSVVRSQRRNQVKDARQQAQLIKELGRKAVISPEERFEKILTALKGPLGSLQGPIAKAFGLSLDRTDPLTVNARRIPGPMLEFKGLKQVSTGSEGAWRAPGGAPIKEPGRWTSGAILVLMAEGSLERQGVDNLQLSLGKQLKAMGCPFPTATPKVWAVPGSRVSKGDVEGLMRKAVEAAKKSCGGKPPELMLVVLPQGGDVEIRNEVKRVGHAMLNVATQCCDSFKAGVTQDLEARKLDQYTSNVALKVNTKLGGTTAELAGTMDDYAPFLEGKHFMVIGADVSRSAAAGRSNTSITYGAVVGTVNRQAVRLSQPQMLVQVGKNDDLIYGMEEAAGELIKSYAGANGGALPEVILLYRDGVSESFYDQVLAKEFTDLKKACASIREGYNPKVTFVIVSRGHNVRFFPARGDDAGTHKSGNILPGTVVDDAIIDKFAFEFYLNSHAGILGTNKVPKYTVLVDEFGFTSDSMQIFTHWLCHTYSLCNRSVSTPPVVKYADKAAEEARQIGVAEAAALVQAAAASGSAAVTSGAFKDYTLLSPLGMSRAQSMSFV